MKKWIDRLARRVFTVSGFVTSAVILLIIGFLFSEAAGLFRQPIVEEGYVLALNKSNTVDRLSAEEIKLLFDEDITNWRDVGGADMPVRVFRLEDLDRLYTEEELGAEYEHAGDKIAEQVRADRGIIAFVPTVLVEGRTDIHLVPDHTIPVKDVLLGTDWYPTATPSPIFGMVPLLAGTLWVSFFAILIALPFGLAVSIYMAEVAPPGVSRVLKPVIELLGGIPHIVHTSGQVAFESQLHGSCYRLELTHGPACAVVEDWGDHCIVKELLCLPGDEEAGGRAISHLCQGRGELRTPCGRLDGLPFGAIRWVHQPPAFWPREGHAYLGLALD